MYVHHSSSGVYPFYRTCKLIFWLQLHLCSIYTMLFLGQGTMTLCILCCCYAIVPVHVC